MQTVSITVSPEDDGKKVKTVLKWRLGFSSHAIGGLTRTETGIRVNGQRVFATAILHTGDVLTAEIGDRKPPDENIIPCDMPLPIVYEDEYLLVVNKPAGMAALASSFLPETPTVAGALVHQKGEGCIFHVVNRLDKNTTGLMVIAKSGYVHNLLRKLLHSGDFHREYRGVCIGCPQPESGVIDLPIGRAEDSAIARCVRSDGAPSVTRYEVMEKTERFALLRLLPQTGRTHQLRLHMSAIGHALAGDWLYGTEDVDLIPRHALHSCALHLVHPVTGETLDLTAPMPEDMARLMTL